MPRTSLATLSGRPKIREYAQGRAREAIGPLADFLAPPVNVSLHTGKYSVYDEKTRFKIPETLRGIGGKATVLEFRKTDQNFDCAPHALDVPVDNIEVEEEDGENLLMESADEAAAIGAMAHAKKVVDLALDRSAVAGVGNWTNASVDPIDELNRQIAAVYLAAGGYPSIEVGIVLPPLSLLTIMGNPKAKAYFPAKQTIAPTTEALQSVLVGKTRVELAWLATDTAPEGKDVTMDWVMGAKCLVFARNANPTRRDPSFMKTFRVRGRWMVPGTYEREDGRGTVTKMDWSEDVVVANSAAVKLIDIS